jgi:hypothetical protein
LISEFNNVERKRVENLTPEMDRGTKYGFVRVGNEWLPSFQTQDFQSLGFGARDQFITLSYGKEMVFTSVFSPDHISYIQPFFLDGRSKTFSLTDAEYAETGKVGKTPGGDRLQNYMFLNAEDTVEMLKGIEEGKNTFVPWTDDKEGWDESTKKMDEWRRIIELMHEDPVSALRGSTGADLFFENYDVTASFRDGVNKEKYSYPSERAETREEKKYYAALKIGGDTFKEYMHSSDFNRYGQPENEYLLNNLFEKQVALLLGTQKQAAEEQGFKQTYYYDPIDARDTASLSGNPIWASLYLDTAKSLQTPKTYDELSEQLQTIQNYNDRSYVQKQYLKEKQFTRYWLEQIGSRGGTQELLDKMYGKQGWGTHDVLKEKLGTGMEYERLMVGMRGENAWNHETKFFKEPMSGQSGWIMPWANANEGILPSDTSNSPIPASYQMELDRLNQEALDHAFNYIEEHGNRNPNELLQGNYYTMGDNSIVDLPKEKPEKEQEDAPPEEIVDLPEEEDKPKEKEKIKDEDPLDILRGLKPKGGWSSEPWHVAMQEETDTEEEDEGDEEEDEGEEEVVEDVEEEEVEEDVGKEDVVQTQEEVTDIVQKQEEARKRREETPLQTYMREEHPSMRLELTPETVPWLSFDKSGNVLLYSDPTLHDEMQLPDNIKAIQSQNGITHTAYDPTAVNPKIHGFHEMGVPEMQHDEVTVT